MTERTSLSGTSDMDRWVRQAFDLTRVGRADEARAWMEKAAAGGHREAPIFAAIWRLVGYAGAVEPESAAAWLARAIENGEPLGLTMLAALAVSDLNGPRDWDLALSRLIEAARLGEQRAVLQLALLLPDDDPERRPLVHAAASLGNGTARYFHGRALYDSSDGAEHAEGVRWLTEMAQRGEPCSRLFLATRGTTAAAGTPESTRPEHTFDWKGISARVAWPHERALPSPVTHLASPRIESLPRLLLREECDFLISRGAPYLQPAQVGAGRAALTSGIRTNDSMLFSAADTDVVVQSIDGLIARALANPPENGERLALLRYLPGQAYAPHCDWIDPSAAGKGEIVAQQGQRIATLLVYLNDGYTGGETRFVRLDWSFRGEPGDALLWDNVDRDGSIDPRTLHTGLSPASGEKWLLSKWMRNRPQAVSAR